VAAALLLAVPFTLAAPTGGALPRDEPENASPVDVPDTDVPLVSPAVGEREAPVKASPLEVPDCGTPLEELVPPVVPVEDDEVVFVLVPEGELLVVAADEPVLPIEPGMVLVAVVALGEPPRVVAP
jgi:hypothetical protein